MLQVQTVPRKEIQRLEKQEEGLEEQWRGTRKPASRIWEH
jgi:hypothetical protein